jgi:hypothetical protein
MPGEFILAASLGAPPQWRRPGARTRVGMGAHRPQGRGGEEHWGSLGGDFGGLVEVLRPHLAGNSPGVSGIPGTVLQSGAPLEGVLPGPVPVHVPEWRDGAGIQELPGSAPGMRVEQPVGVRDCLCVGEPGGGGSSSVGILLCGRLVPGVRQVQSGPEKDPQQQSGSAGAAGADSAVPPGPPSGPPPDASLGRASE